MSQEAASRLSKLRTELEELAGAVGKEREKYQAQVVTNVQQVRVHKTQWSFALSLKF